MRRSLLAPATILTLLAAGCGGTEPEVTTTLGTLVTTPSSTEVTSTAPTDQVDPSQPSTDEIRFRSGEFELVGSLHLPAGNGPHGAVIMVHGSGAQTRDSTPTSGLVKMRFQDAGYAVLSWDKPGSGESTGEFDAEFGKTQRAMIVADAIALLSRHPAVDPDRIGLWGLSEAGWVMPLALTMTNDIAFMIVVSGGGEDSIEQGVYQWTQQARCRGASDEEIAIMDQHGAPALKAATYAEYRDAMDALLTIPDLNIYIGVAIEMQEEDDWGPWPRDIDAFFDPMEVIEHTTIPVLAIFGEHDTQVDPIQGAEAYQAALEQAGNTEFHVEVIPDVGHTLTPSRSDGCVRGGGGYTPRYLELIDEWIERLQR